MKKIAFALIVPLCLMLSACGLKPVVPTRVTDVQFSSIDILRGTVVMDMGLEINNQNNFAITIHGMELNVSIDSIPMGVASITDKIKIAKDTQMVYRVKVQAKLTDLIHGIPAVLNAIKKKQTHAAVNGWVQAGAFGLKRKFPVSINQEAVQTGQQ